MVRAFADIDADLKSWSERVTRIGRSIETLSQSAAFLRLKAQTRRNGLSGVSKARGAAAVSALDQIWSLYLSLDQALTRAEELRAGKNPLTMGSRYEEIDALLQRPSVRPPEEATSLATLKLDAGPEHKMALTDVVAAMEKAFNIARDCVAAAERGWAETQVLDPLRARAQALANEAKGLQFAPPLQLAEVLLGLDEAAKAADADPLGVDQTAAAVARLLDEADAALTGARVDRDAAEAFLDGAQARIDALASLHAQTEATREKRLAAVSEPLPEAPPPADPLPALRGWLEKLREAMATGRAKAVNIGAKSWQAQCDSDAAALKTCLDADKKILTAREDLRGRFSALKARANHLAVQGRLNADDSALMIETAGLLFGRATPLPQAVQNLRRCERI